MDADSTNLDALQSHGGKLLIYHGGSDPVFSMNDTIQYYNQVSAAYGSKATGFARLFLVPGMNHCVGGDYTADSFDSLDAIVTWAENGIPPTRLLAQPGDIKTSKLPSGTTRPLCPYPSYAQYKGKGESLEATHFSCVRP
jgi:feruloyl esterase